jgi:hypothetical protein
MPSTFRAAALAAAIIGSLTAVTYAQPAKQPAKQPAPAAKQAQPPQQAQPAEEGPPQIALTEQQVQGFVTATPDISKITSKLKAEPDKKTQAQLDALAKKGGFASYEEYDTVAANISMVMQGIDPQTKKFGDPKAMIQAQIAQVQADKKMKPAEKKQALEELNQAVNEVQPIKNQGNIVLVEKNYDQLAKLMQQ